MTERNLRSTIFGILDAERAKGTNLQVWLSQDIICDLLDGPELAPYIFLMYCDVTWTVPATETPVPSAR